MKRLVVACAMLAFFITLPSTPFLVPEPRDPRGGKKGGLELPVPKPAEVYVLFTALVVSFAGSGLSQEIAALTMRVETTNTRIDVYTESLNKQVAAIDKKTDDIKATIDKQVAAIDKKTDDIKATIDKQVAAIDKKTDEIRERSDLTSVAAVAAFALAAGIVVAPVLQDK